MEDKNQNQKTTEIQKETEDKNTESDACKKQAEEYLNNWKRERADFVNYKKDEGKRMEEFVKFANESLILELLDVVDDLYLAAKQTKDTGLNQVIKKFEYLLKKYGVEKIEDLLLKTNLSEDLLGITGKNPLSNVDYHRE